jgi:hypothetical protein
MGWFTRKIIHHTKLHEIDAWENLLQNELNIHANDLHKNSLVINVNRVENMLTYEDDVLNKKNI